MKKLKVVSVVGTRPEIIRLSRVLAKLDDYCEHVLVHTGQNYDYELNQIFFEDLGVRKPDHFLNAAGATGAETIGKVVIAVDQVLAEEKPDAMLVLGDTNSCLSVIPAKRRKIPIFHMEAGNRCFDQRVPEEINRRIVDHTADVNLIIRPAKNFTPGHRYVVVLRNLKDASDNAVSAQAPFAKCRDNASAITDAPA